MQVRKPDAPISATPSRPPKKEPEQRPTADSSRLTCTWRNRVSLSRCFIKGAIQPSGRLATSPAPPSESTSAITAATCAGLRRACVSTFMGASIHRQLLELRLIVMVVVFQAQGLYRPEDICLRRVVRQKGTECLCAILVLLVACS